MNTRSFTVRLVSVTIQFLPLPSSRMMQLMRPTCTLPLVSTTLPYLPVRIAARILSRLFISFSLSCLCSIPSVFLLSSPHSEAGFLSKLFGIHLVHHHTNHCIHVHILMGVVCHANVKQVVGTIEVFHDTEAHLVGVTVNLSANRASLWDFHVFFSLSFLLLYRHYTGQTLGFKLGLC